MTKLELTQMLARKQALRKETLDRYGRESPMYALIKREHGLRGSRQSVFTQYCELVERAKGEVQ